MPPPQSAVGVSTSALAEAVDLYPTLSELAGLALPTGLGGEYLGGVSLVPVMKDPAGPGVKNATLSQFPRCWQNNTHHTARAVRTSGRGVPGMGPTNPTRSCCFCFFGLRFLDF